MFADLPVSSLDAYRNPTLMTKNFCLLQRYLAIFILLMASSGFLGAYNIQRITRVDGLTNSSINSMGQLDNGMLLFGTFDGVSCYDGVRLWPLSASLGGMVVEEIVCGKGNLIWILTNHGVCSFHLRDGNIQNLDLQNAYGIRKNDDGDVFALQNGTLYALSENGVVAKASLGKVRSEQICDFALVDKHLYLFTVDGILRYEMTSADDGYVVGKMQKISNLKLTRSFREDSAEFLVGQNGMLWKFSFATAKAVPVVNLTNEIEKRGNVSGISSIRHCYLLSFEGRGVVRVCQDGGNYAMEDLGVQSGVMSSLKDRSGDVVWLGTDGQGIAVYKEDYYSVNNVSFGDLGLKGKNPARGMFLDGERSLWIGTKGRGLIRVKNFHTEDRFHESEVLTQENSGLPGNMVFSVVRSPKRNGFWIGTDRGVAFYSYQTRSILPVAVNVPLSWVGALCEQGDTLWVATQGMGVYKAVIAVGDGGWKLQAQGHYVLDNGVKNSNYFFTIAVNPKTGVLYAGNRGKGLYALRGNTLKSVQPVDSSHDVGLLDVYSLLFTDEGGWMGTGRGLVYWGADGKSELIGQENGMPSSIIHALSQDKDGNVWASTNNGVARVLHGSHEIIALGEGDGLEISEFCDGAAWAGNGYVSFGGNNGLVVIQRNALQAGNHRMPPFLFNSITIDGAPRDIWNFLTLKDDGSQRLRLPGDQNTFQLSGSTFDYLNLPFCHFYYRLSGKGNWIDNGFSETFSFTGLSYGSHTLEVKYRNLMTGEESQVSTVTIVIPAPWYLRWWAILFYLLLIATVSNYAYRHWKERQRNRRMMLDVKREMIQRERIYNMKMRFLTNVTHELNTPLSLAIGPCEHILKYEGTDAVVTKYVNMVMRNLKRLNRLIQEIIDFRRISGGAVTAKIKPVAVSEWMNYLAGQFKDMAENQQIDYEMNFQEGVVWNLDEYLLSRIVENLISNALKYTVDGGQIRVTMAVENDNLRISVYNTGKGIAEKNRKSIFNYYAILDNVNESSTAGFTSRNGLGLAICKSAVEQLHGKIEIDSEVEKFADFIVVLPQNSIVEEQPVLYPPQDEDVLAVTTEEAAEEPVAEEPSEDSASPEYSAGVDMGSDRPLVLVIDDNSDMLDLLRDTLSPQYRVCTADSAQHGLEQLKQKMPDLIITDVMMPNMDGLELVQQLKQDKYTTNIPLVILSAKRSNEEQVKGLKSGADAYVTKPFSSNYLLATVARLLETRSSLRAYYKTSAASYLYQDGRLMSEDEREFRERLVEVIQANLVNPEFNPELLAKELNISLRNLYRRFSDAGLPTPKEFIKSHRIATAAHLLVTTKKTIQEIIYTSGFNTRTQFYSEFRKHYGVAPREYREQSIDENGK